MIPLALLFPQPYLLGLKEGPGKLFQGAATPRIPGIVEGAKKLWQSPHGLKGGSLQPLRGP